ncbi:hypothetical protein N0V94_001066 [Neodidymelliopsis sp. IMI 364377]|nr:hypothetical protein N0V94_001066 [Neodidymelliopsis sp. IMI 364377]
MADEVLVHISTSATRQNDELFRSLAKAYTAFQPSRSYEDGSVQKRVWVDRSVELEPDANSMRSGEDAIGEATEVSMLTASKESYGSFPSSMSSGECTDDRSANAADHRDVRPGSRLAQLDRSYLSWRKRTKPDLTVACSKRELPYSSSVPEEVDTGFIEDSQMAVQALQSQLQDTYSTTSADTSEDEEHRGGSHGAGQEVGHEDNSNEELYVGPAEDQQSVAVEQIGVEEGSTSTSSKEALAPSIDAVQQNQSKNTPTVDHNAVTGSTKFSMLPVYVVPPAPAISVARADNLPSQITKHLAAIKMKDPDRFAPIKVRRALNNDERGYWLFECTRWSSELQWEFWKLLHEHICSGRVGWGTTLYRETESDHTLGRIRLYCWGEVVEHMWLLAWLCSEGRVSGSESSWIDADGIAVLEMR